MRSCFQVVTSATLSGQEPNFSHRALSPASPTLATRGRYFSLHGDDLGVVDDAVDEGRGDRRVGEDVRPIDTRRIRRQESRHHLPAVVKSALARHFEPVRAPHHRP